MGAYKIEKIHVDICQKHVDEWATKLKKFRMVKAYAAKVLDFAIKRGYIQTNPFTHVDLPATLLRRLLQRMKMKQRTSTHVSSLLSSYHA